MPVIRIFSDLDQGDREMVFQFAHRFAPARFPSFEALQREFVEAHYERGATQLSAWDGGAIAACVGAVVREVPLKGEAYLTNCYASASDRDAFEAALDAALALVPAHRPTTVKLGLQPDHDHILEWAEARGFSLVYTLDEYLLAAAGIPAEVPAGIRFADLCQDNGRHYQSLANRSFRDSPNGATVTDEDLAILLGNPPEPGLLSICYQGAAPLGYFELSHDKDTGWIDAVGVDPEHQGRGIGRLLLARAVRVLRDRGAVAIRLRVIDSNRPAVALYLKTGFVRERPVSLWLERSSGR